MHLTVQQLAFLMDLRKGARPAIAAQDASVIGPLIRADLVRWDDNPSETGTRRRPQGSSFALTETGALRLAEHEKQASLPEWGSHRET